MRDGLILACRVNERGYSCMYCNKWWMLSDPGFDYFREFGERNWLVREGYARPGDPMNLIDVCTGKPFTRGGYDTWGRFAQCVDKDACDRRRYNLHNGVDPEQQVLRGLIQC